MDHKSLKYIFTHSDLNLRQKRWMEYLINFVFYLLYHPGKANVVGDALSQKERQHSYKQVARFWVMSGQLIAMMHVTWLLASSMISNDLIEQVK